MMILAFLTVELLGFFISMVDYYSFKLFVHVSVNLSICLMPVHPHFHFQMIT